MSADFSKYTSYTPESGGNSVVYGSDAPVLEVELNEMQEIMKTRLGYVIRSIVGNSIIKSKLDFTISTVTITGGYGFFDGGVVFISKLVANLTPNTKVLLRITEREVDRYSTLYKYGNKQETQVENHIFDSRIGIITTKRRILEYDLVVVPATVTPSSSEVLIVELGSTTNVSDFKYLVNPMTNGMKDQFDSAGKLETMQAQTANQVSGFMGFTYDSGGTANSFGEVTKVLINVPFQAKLSTPKVTITGAFAVQTSTGIVTLSSLVTKTIAKDYVVLEGTLSSGYPLNSPVMLVFTTTSSSIKIEA